MYSFRARHKYTVTLDVYMTWNTHLQNNSVCLEGNAGILLGDPRVNVRQN